MKFETPVNIETIANLISAKVIGNKSAQALGINELHKVEQGDLVFVDHPKYYDTCLNSAATFIIINKEINNFPEGKTILVTDTPFDAYCKIVQHFRPFVQATETINSNKIGANTIIYPTAFVGNNVTIGTNCIIHPHVTILDHCIIGNNVVIQAGTVIGSDAFYYNTKKDREVWYKKMPSCGRVVIEDDVEIGANCTIDRGVSHDTILGKGTRFDNMIHVGHDTVFGKNCLVAANAVIAGCVTIKNGVTIWGGCIINKTLTIGENAVLLGRTGVGGNLEGNKTYWGAPAQEASVVKREMIWIKRIPALWDKVMKG
ncbi:MAG: LpxD N-terminal domain-containing protein [Ferruginibacter sp.]|nr:UDP-3-O-(3-hydroxymyristoyl)glucosamine N-acyltransferase [Ferruginibacter sp.]